MLAGPHVISRVGILTSSLSKLRREREKEEKGGNFSNNNQTMLSVYAPIMYKARFKLTPEFE